MMAVASPLSLPKVGAGATWCTRMTCCEKPTTIYAQRSRRLRLVSCMLVGFSLTIYSNAGVRATNLALTAQDIERALKIAAGPREARARFHAPYVISLNDATVEQVEVVTEFRRYVITAEEQASLGNWIVAQGGSDLAGHTLKGMLLPWKDKLSIKARLRFHPQNTFSEIPPAECVIGGSPPIRPLNTIRSPINALLSGQPFAPLMGAVVETVFDATAVGQTTRPVGIAMNGQELKRLPIDFGRLQ